MSFRLLDLYCADDHGDSLVSSARSHALVILLKSSEETISTETMPEPQGLSCFLAPCPAFGSSPTRLQGFEADLHLHGTEYATLLSILYVNARSTLFPAV